MEFVQKCVRALLFFNVYALPRLLLQDGQECHIPGSCMCYWEIKDGLVGFDHCIHNSLFHPLCR